MSGHTITTMMSNYQHSQYFKKLDDNNKSIGTTKKLRKIKDALNLLFTVYRPGNFGNIVLLIRISK